MENERKDLAVIEPSEGELEDALQIIESRNALFARVMRAAIKATSPSDWIDQQGKPYLQSSGAEKIARRFGVRIFDVVIERENITDDNGPYYLYTVTGKAALGSGNESIETIGTCSSRDKFFGRKNGENKPMQDVDMGNVKKKAYTNFMGNAITRLLGVRNLTWEELADHGICKDGKASVNYKGAAEKATESKTSDNAQAKSGKPYSTWDYNGTTYIGAYVGRHFSEEFLKNLGLKKSQKKEGLYSGPSSSDLENAINDEYIAAEEQLAIQQEGSAK